MLAPSGPGIACDLPRDMAYRAAVQGADLILPDSGAMVLAWNILHAFRPKYRLRRLSGLQYLRALVGEASFREPGATFWVMPSKNDLMDNLDWLRKNGFEHLSEDDCYLAPMYKRDKDGGIVDPELARIIREKRPRYVILNIGGGTQEQLGWWLKRELADNTAIICTGAAIAFLSGRQANIPGWADRLYCGWFLRCLSAPTKFVPRYWEAKDIFWVILRYRSRLPDMRIR
ncbi:MAG: WecB/TagA/CpsF family glycosyltransferase [Terrimicrobiaceae bacterium]|nr:WecB/TagA/CpsF family glycosyltransferase [Terrimicrobiaceae bacterium]